MITNRADVDAVPLSDGRLTPIYWSSELDRFGVRVGMPEKAFVVGCRVDKQRTWVLIGRFGRITFQKAISDAKQLLGEMVSGIDPVARKRDQPLVV